MLDRRLFLANASLGLAGMVAGCKDPAVPLSIGAAAPALPLPDFYAEIEYRTFRYFRDTVNPLNGLVPERWPSPSAGEHRGGRLRADDLADRGRARLDQARPGAGPDAGDAALFRQRASR